MESNRARIAASAPHPAGGTHADHADKERREERRGGKGERAGSGSHIVAIDGLRALAILGVVAYHTRPSLLQGGFLGVTMFFVVSGFLITRSVMAQLDRSRTFAYGTYLIRRLKRLVPPVAVIITLAAAASYLVSPSLLPKAQADALPSMLFVGNWVYIFRHVSYFAAAGLPSPLTHLWFLGVLMQFYLLWPLVLIVLHRLLRQPGARVAVVAVLMLVSCVLMGVLYDPAAAGSRVYYGLDTRASELLAGALLAMLLHGRQSGRRAGRAPRRAAGRSAAHDANRPADGSAAGATEATTGKTGPVALLGVVSLALTLVAFVTVRSDFAPLYCGGYLVMALLTALLLAVAMVPGDPAGRILSTAPLRYIGSRSFSLYLVHYPMLEMMNPATRTTALAWWEPIAQTAALWAATELFYQLVERVLPHRDAAARSSAHAVSRHRAVPSRDMRVTVTRIMMIIRRIITVICAVCVVALVALPLPWERVAQDRSAQLRPVTAAVESESTRSRTQPKKKEPAKPKTTDQSDQSDQSNGQTADQNGQTQPQVAPKLVPVAEKVPANLDTTGWTYDASSGVCSADPLIISDSVEMGAQRVLVNTMPNAIQDNKIGRSLSAFPEVYQQHLAAGENKRVTVAALGSNEGSASGAQQKLETIVQAVNGQPLYFITIRNPSMDQNAMNAAMRAVAAKYKNVGIMDWYGLSEGHSEYFYDDGVHLTIGNGLGRDAYSHMVIRAMCGQ